MKLVGLTAGSTGAPGVTVRCRPLSRFCWHVRLPQARSWPVRPGSTLDAHSSRPRFNLSSQDRAAVDRGEILARSIDPADDREVATLGVMRLEVSPHTKRSCRSVCFPYRRRWKMSRH